MFYIFCEVVPSEGEGIPQYLLLQLVQLSCLRVYVDDGFVFDLPGPVSITQSVQGLLQVGVCWAHTGDHQRVAVPSQRVWQGTETVSIPIPPVHPQNAG